jgi:hypothetical protein
VNITKKTGLSLVVLGLSMFFVSLVYAKNLPEEVVVMQKKFSEQVSSMPFSESYEQMLADKALNVLQNSRDGLPKTSQFFLLVNKNKDDQTASFAFFDQATLTVTVLGTAKTSTGKASRLGSYETPIGVFKNTVNNPSYRALGTKNERGWRGLGGKGSRVWDLGWQTTKHHKSGNIDIRLLVHATDPDQGEQRLGKQDSQGCVRISGKFNRFLDYYGILDADYENNEKAKWVLLKQREPNPFAGNLVVIIDTNM